MTQPNVDIILDVTGGITGAPGEPVLLPYSFAGSPQPIVCSVEDTTNITEYYWEFIDKPGGAESVVFDDPTAAEPSFTPATAVAGSYLISCTVNGGDSHGRNGFAILTEFEGLRKLAAGEAGQFDKIRGWVSEVNKLFTLLDSYSPNAVNTDNVTPVPAVVEEGSTLTEVLNSLTTKINTVAGVMTQTTFYVATSGSDTLGEGTFVSPFATIERCFQFIPNELPASTHVVIKVANGTYETFPGYISHKLKKYSQIIIDGYEGHTVNTVYSSLYTVDSSEVLGFSSIRLNLASATFGADDIRSGIGTMAFVKFLSGSLTGRVFPVFTNGASDVVIGLKREVGLSVSDGDQFRIVDPGVVFETSSKSVIALDSSEPYASMTLFNVALNSTWNGEVSTGQYPAALTISGAGSVNLIGCSIKVTGAYPYALELGTSWVNYYTMPDETLVSYYSELGVYRPSDFTLTFLCTVNGHLVSDGSYASRTCTMFNRGTQSTGVWSGGISGMSTRNDVANASGAHVSMFWCCLARFTQQSVKSAAYLSGITALSPADFAVSVDYGSSVQLWGLYCLHDNITTTVKLGRNGSMEAWDIVSHGTPDEYVATVGFGSRLLLADVPTVSGATADILFSRSQLERSWPSVNSYEWDMEAAFVSIEGGVVQAPIMDARYVPRSMGQTDFYVATTGNDTIGDGTVGNPFATINRCMEVIPETIPPDTSVRIRIANGEYSYPVKDFRKTIDSRSQLMLEGYEGPIEVQPDVYTVDAVTYNMYSEMVLKAEGIPGWASDALRSSTGACRYIQMLSGNDTGRVYPVSYNSSITVAVAKRGYATKDLTFFQDTDIAVGDTFKFVEPGVRIITDRGAVFSVDSSDNLAAAVVYNVCFKSTNTDYTLADFSFSLKGTAQYLLHLTTFQSEDIIPSVGIACRGINESGAVDDSVISWGLVTHDLGTLCYFASCLMDTGNFVNHSGVMVFSEGNILSVQSSHDMGISGMCTRNGVSIGNGDLRLGYSCTGRIYLSRPDSGLRLDICTIRSLGSYGITATTGSTLSILGLRFSHLSAIASSIVLEEGSRLLDSDWFESVVDDVYALTVGPHVEATFQAVPDISGSTADIYFERPQLGESWPAVSKYSWDYENSFVSVKGAAPLTAPVTDVRYVLKSMLSGIRVEASTSETPAPAEITTSNIHYGSIAGTTITFTFLDDSTQSVTFGVDTDTQAEALSDLNAQLTGYTAEASDASNIRIYSDISDYRQGIKGFPSGGTFVFPSGSEVDGVGIPTDAAPGEFYRITDGVNSGRIVQITSDSPVYYDPIEYALIMDVFAESQYTYRDSAWVPLGRKRVRVISDSTAATDIDRDKQWIRWDDEGQIVRYAVLCYSGTRTFTIPTEFFSAESFEMTLQVSPAINGDIRFLKEGETDYWYLPVDDDHGFFATYHLVISGGQFSINGKSDSELLDVQRHALTGTDVRAYKDLTFEGISTGSTTSEVSTYLSLLNKQSGLADDGFTRVSGEVWIVEFEVTGAVSDGSTNELYAFCTFKGTQHCSPIDGTFYGAVTLVNLQQDSGSYVSLLEPQLVWVSNDLRIKCRHQHLYTDLTEVIWVAKASIRVISGASVATS